MSKFVSKGLAIFFLILILFLNIFQIGTVVQAGSGWWNASTETGKACEYLVKNLGFTKYAAAGLLGNFKQESYMNPYVRERIGDHNTYSLGKEKADLLDPDNDGYGPGRGLAQWGDGSGVGGLGSGRWIELLKYVNATYGTSYSSTYKDSYRPDVWNNEKNVRANIPNMYQQLDFVKYEMTRGSKYILSQKDLNATASVDDASDAVLYRYEKAGTKTSEKRRQFSREIYQQYCSRIDGIDKVEVFKNGGAVDNIAVVDNKLAIKGWHASAGADKHQRYMFIMDVATNKEVQRLPINNEQRPDIARALPDVTNAIESGFNVSVPISEQMKGKTLYVITRYLVNNNPDESLYDMWFVDNKVVVPGGSGVAINYQSHVQNIGWQAPVGNGEVAGTFGQSLRMEALKINLENAGGNSGIACTAHVQDYGWLKEVTNHQVAGTTGQYRRMEAINIRLTGDIENQYDIYYRAHIQNYGWLGWTKNGQNAGSSGKWLRLESIEIRLVKKGDGNAPSVGRAFIQ